MQNNKQIYFDVAATTPLDNKVLDLITSINSNYFGNPSSIHQYGQKSHNLIEKSRISIAEIFNCSSSEIIFTSGGSESNNLILKGILEKGDHFITSSYEHPSILNLSKIIESKGVEVTYVKPDKNGIINPYEIENKIKKNTKLISIMYVNNELGTINPIDEISDISRKNNVLFHTDAVQIIGKKNINLNSSNIDFMSGGAHKFYGPKGIGFLYARKGINLNPIIEGGGQESGMRAGTENISFIAAMCLALEISHSDLDKNNKKILKLENRLIKKLDGCNIDYRINGKNRLPGFLNITFFNVDGNNLLMNLDMNKIAISFGSACSSGSVKAPLTLLETGMPDNEAKCTVRISIGKFIVDEDIDTLAKTLNEIILRIKL